MAIPDPQSICYVIIYHNYPPFFEVGYMLNLKPTLHSLIIYFTYRIIFKNKESKGYLPHLRDKTTGRELVVDGDCILLSRWLVPLSLNSTTPHGIHQESAPPLLLSSLAPNLPH